MCGGVALVTGDFCSVDTAVKRECNEWCVALRMTYLMAPPFQLRYELWLIPCSKLLGISSSTVITIIRLSFGLNLFTWYFVDKRKSLQILIPCHCHRLWPNAWTTWVKILVGWLRYTIIMSFGHFSRQTSSSSPPYSFSHFRILSVQPSNFVLYSFATYNLQIHAINFLYHSI